MATKTETLTALDGTQIHPSWLKSGSEIAMAIMRGEYDDQLTSIGNAVSGRNKTRFRKGARFVLRGTKNPEIDGKECTVIKVNPKRISVGIGAPVTEYGSTYYPEGEFNVPPSMLHIIDVASTS